MTNMRGVGGAPRGLRTQQQSLHGRRPHEIRRTTAPTRRASSQRSTARKDSANATNVPPTNERQSTTNEKSSHPQPTHLQLNSKPTNLNGDDQGDHAIARTGARPIEAVRPAIQTTGKRYGRIATKIRGTKGADGTISRVEIIGRTGEHAEIRGFSEVAT